MTGGHESLHFFINNIKINKSTVCRRNLLAANVKTSFMVTLAITNFFISDKSQIEVMYQNINVSFLFMDPNVLHGFA
jgi:hypothetical protein